MVAFSLSPVELGLHTEGCRRKAGGRLHHSVCALPSMLGSAYCVLDDNQGDLDPSDPHSRATARAPSPSP